jgi:hypothetical protein
MGSRPKLSARKLKAIEEALDDLGSSTVYNPKRMQVAADSLASTLRKGFSRGKKNVFGADAPSLHAILEAMHDSYGVEDSVVDAASDLMNLIEETYEDDIDEFIGDEIRENRNIIVEGSEGVLGPVEND